MATPVKPKPTASSAPAASPKPTPSSQPSAPPSGGGDGGDFSVPSADGTNPVGKGATNVWLYTGGSTGGTPNRVSLENAISNWTYWASSDDPRFTDLADLLGEERGRKSLDSWRTSVIDAATTRATFYNANVTNPVVTASGAPPISWYEYLNESQAASATAGTAGAYSGPHATTTLSNQTSSDALVEKVLGSYLGTSPTSRQKSEFLAILNNTEAANPGVSTPHGKGATTNSGELDRTQVAVDYAKSQEGYAETQANTTGMDIFKKVVMGEPGMI